MKKVIIIGGGAAGMMAAVSCGEDKNLDVTVIEGSEKLGKKLFITGKGRCNVFNDCDRTTFFSNVVSNERFMYSSYSAFDSASSKAFFEELGLEMKVERGNRVFPVSDHSSDVIRALSDRIKRNGVHVKLNTKVTDIIEEDDHFVAVQTDKGEVIKADACIMATGGMSYPTTGSTGDGYRFAKKFGHSVTPPVPALCGLKVKEKFIGELEGLSLKNIAVYFEYNGKEIYSDFGEMLFTFTGVSGPVILSGSSYLAKYFRNGAKGITLSIDLKPALNHETLNARILRDFEAQKNKAFKNSLGGLLPIRLAEKVVTQSGIDPEKQVNSVTAAEREQLTELIKNFKLEITGSSAFNEAIITQGGINVKEVDPKTMASKKLEGLFIAGEVLDVDALTGGFNLQIAWSTGSAAARGVKSYLGEI